MAFKIVYQFIGAFLYRTPLTNLIECPRPQTFIIVNKSELFPIDFKIVRFNDNFHFYQVHSFCILVSSRRVSRSLHFGYGEKLWGTFTIFFNNLVSISHHSLIKLMYANLQERTWLCAIVLYF